MLNIITKVKPTETNPIEFFKILYGNNWIIRVYFVCLTYLFIMRLIIIIRFHIFWFMSVYTLFFSHLSILYVCPIILLWDYQNRKELFQMVYVGIWINFVLFVCILIEISIVKLFNIQNINFTFQFFRVSLSQYWDYNNLNGMYSYMMGCFIIIIAYFYWDWYCV